MLFPSEEFLFAFLPAVVVIYYLLPSRNVMLKNIILLFASIFFYAYGEKAYVFLMLAVILFDYGIALLLDWLDSCSGVRRVILCLAIIANLSVLAVYKYAGFAISEFLRFSGSDRVSSFNPVLPIGISFFTFQAMSYVLDVYKGSVKVQKNPLYVALYVAFFPQLIAGPIVRYGTIEAAIKDRKESITLFCQGVVRFLKGLIKKVIIANNMALVADAVWQLIIGGRLQAAVSMAWLGAISYTLQIYFDFSGYSDMAIGLGKMFGFEFPENFSHPYIARSITEFWRRWHISLSTWFRDYVYIPLGGSKHGKGRTLINMFIVWCLTGIWHGANWTFLVWGLLYFIVLSMEKLAGVRIDKSGRTVYSSFKRERSITIKKVETMDSLGTTVEYDAAGKKLTSIFGHIYTLLIVCLAWVIFRSDSLSDAFIFIRGMFGIGSGRFIDNATLAYLKQNAVYYVAAILACMPIVDRFEQFLDVTGEANRGRHSVCIMLNVLYVIGILGLSIIAISFIINNAYSPFIYFNF